MNDLETRTSSDCFPATLWTDVIEVIQQPGDAGAAVAERALEEFCVMYRPAIYNFFRRKGHDHADAEDLTQAFLQSRVLGHGGGGKGLLSTADRTKTNRFRSFLSQVMWRFLTDEWRKKSRVTKGGQAPHVPVEDADQGGECADAHSFERFGREFDRALALEIIRRASERAGHSDRFMAHMRGEITQAEAAKAQDISEEAFKLGYHRFRQRLGRELLTEVRKLVGPDKEEIRSEINYLISVFAESP